MKVQITQEDIYRGEQSDGLKCPLALALKRKKVLTGRVQGKWAQVKGRIYRIAPHGREWIRAFDHRTIGAKAIRPITIRLDAPRRTR